MLRRSIFSAAAAVTLALTAQAMADRATGIDVSYWQGSINWTSVANSGVDFTFIRSSRGGTTGTYNQSTQVGTLSHRYDDPTFVTNITGATSKGILAGPYHYARIDRINATDPSDPTYTGNTGLDEANHFIQQAGNYMRPGYLRPVVDVEAGDTQTTKAQMSAWVLQFSDRILAVTGVRPIVYINSNYANNEVDSSLNTHDLWEARYTTAVDPLTAVDLPAAGGLPNVYGVWNPTYPSMPATRPWDFWQYSSTGTTPGISGNVDQDVANGDINFVKDFLVPALWTPDASGEWTTAANWNGVTVTPKPIDRVIVNRTAGNYTIHLDSGSQSVRSLEMRENLTIDGGSLAVEQYISVPVSSSAVTMTNGTVTSASFNNVGTFTQSGGTFTTGAVTNDNVNGSLAVTGGSFRSTAIRQSSLTVSGIFGGGTVELLGTGTSVVKSLAAGGDGHLDIGAAKFIIDHGASSPLAAIQGALASGNIMTSSVGGGSVGVAYFTTADYFGTATGTFGGVTVDSTSILLTRALKGDANANGIVDFNDLVTLAQGYGTIGHWRQGDFTYDGMVDFNDLVSLAQNYNGTLLSGDALITAGGSPAFAADWALAQSLVPEPTLALAILALGATGRRTRRPVSSRRS